MVMLLFYVGDERYACDCDHIVEIVPRLSFKPVAHAPPYLVGLVRYNGSLIPVIDFAQLRDGRPCTQCFSTRIIIFKENPDEERSRMIGLMAERVTETIAQNPTEFTQQGVAFQDAPYLSGVFGEDQGVIQLIDVSKLFPIVHHVFSEV